MKRTVAVGVYGNNCELVKAFEVRVVSIKEQDLEALFDKMDYRCEFIAAKTGISNISWDFM